MLTAGSLFSGIGGIDLGLEQAGFEIKWQVEIDDYCTRVLEKHWSNVARFGDVRDCGRQNLTTVDLICGGFPCQPVSVAGDRRGDTDERWLWPEFYRIICELSPRWVLVENVLGILSADDGRLFGGILRDLASVGYNATWNVLSAAAFGAPHLRERVFLVANDGSKRIQGFWQEQIQGQPAFSWCKDVRGIKDLRNRPDIPEPLIRGNGNGVSERLAALGNAVVPQITEWIGKRIIEVDSLAGN